MNREEVKVFIASTQNLQQDREEIRLFIRWLNNRISNFSLNAIVWELHENLGFHSYSIQNELNNAFDSSNVQIVLLYNQLSEITEEVLRRGLALKKKIIILFKKGFEPETKRQLEEYSKVLELKDFVIHEQSIMLYEYTVVQEMVKVLSNELLSFFGLLEIKSTKNLIYNKNTNQDNNYSSYKIFSQTTTGKKASEEKNYAITPKERKDVVSPKERKDVKIFIASSNELYDERKLIKEFIYDQGKNYPSLHIEPVLWEIDTEKGSIDKGINRFQDKINEDLKNCDITIVLFYSKVGKFTVEEYENSLINSKKIYVLFKEGFTTRDTEELEGFKEVLEFQEVLRKEEKVIYQLFSDDRDLTLLLYESLPRYLNRFL